MEKTTDNDDQEQVRQIRSFRASLLEMMEQLKSYPIIFTTAAYDLMHLVPSLKRAGGFDRHFFIPKMPDAVVGREFVEAVGKDVFDESINSSLAKVGNLIKEEYNNKHSRKSLILATARTHQKRGGKLCFMDMVSLVVAGAGDEEDALLTCDYELHHIAVHEAGHAAIAMLMTNGENIPEYSSIVASKDIKGIVVESISYGCSKGDLYTYADFKRKVRIFLAGRAAKQVVLGFDAVSDGSSEDLEKANRIAARAFAICGFSPNMDNLENAAMNLAVIIGDASTSEMAHVEYLVRRFLAAEYKATVQLLQDNRPMLDAITNRLREHSILDQEELSRIYAEHKSGCNCPGQVECCA